VVRFDNRDTGQSSHWPPGAPGYGIEDMADDILAVMDGLGLAQAHVIGMSLGGFVAQMAALRAPGRVRSLILMGSEPLGWTGAALPGIAERFMAHFAGFADLDWSDPDAVVGFRLEIARLCGGSAYPFDAKATWALLAADHLRSVSPASAFNHSMLEMRESWDGAVQRLSLPVLVLHGEEDPILPLENGQALARTIQGARFVVLDGVGHEIPLPLVPRLQTEVAGFVLDVERAA
jgi:pimeloyl-ACP methyl ester carboxylesterase